MKELHKRDNTTEINVEPNEGERTLLCSNESGTRSPSLDLTIRNHKPTEDELIKRLAEILVEGFLWRYEHDLKYKQQNSSDILPGIDKGTG